MLGLAVGALAVWCAQRSRLRAFESKRDDERSKRADADIRVAELTTMLAHEQDAAAGRAGLKDEFADAFRALSAEAVRQLRTQSTDDLETRQKTLERMVAPIQESLTKVDSSVRELEKVRSEAYGSLTAQVRSLAETQDRLRTETASLVTALRAPAVRGRWGEMQLRRAVEAAGMVAYCDFVEQETATLDGRALRPDLVVRLPGQKNVVVDAKAPLQAYLDAVEATDPDVEQARLRDHGRQVRDHVTKLAAKSYWEQFQPTPELVVLFVPGEQLLSAALEHDPQLLEDAAKLGVVLASPATLITLLLAVARGWREETVAESARIVSDLGKELYDRIRTMAGHFIRVGKSLDGAVGAYNEAAGSLERRVLVTARRFSDLGIAPSGEIPVPEQLERSARALQAPELVAAALLPAAAQADASPSERGDGETAPDDHSAGEVADAA